MPSNGASDHSCISLITHLFPCARQEEDNASVSAFEIGQMLSEDGRPVSVEEIDSQLQEYAAEHTWDGVSGSLLDFGSVWELNSDAESSHARLAGLTRVPCGSSSGRSDPAGQRGRGAGGDGKADYLREQRMMREHQQVQWDGVVAIGGYGTGRTPGWNCHLH